MKLHCEVPLTEVKTFEESHFSWLAKSNSDNLLFTFENRKRMRVFAIKNKNASRHCNSNNNKQASRAHEAQSASLAEPRQCTSSSWNRDESLLALVVDRRQIYFWEVHLNTFVQFKPKYLMQEQQLAAGEEASVGARRRASGKYIDHIAWSKSSDKLAICFGDAQILLCNVIKNSERSYVSSWERLIGNSEGLLKQINSIHVSEHADLFVCSSLGNELLAMTFDGGNRLYCQGESDGNKHYNMKLSPPIREYDARLGAYREDKLSLAYQRNRDSGLFLRKISLDYTSRQLQEDAASARLAIFLQDPVNTDEGVLAPCSLVDFYWLNSTRLIGCLSSGSIQILTIKNTAQTLLSLSESNSSPMPLHVTKSEVLRVRTSGLEADKAETRQEDEVLKAFELVQSVRKPDDSDYRQGFAFAAITNYKLHYYEIYESREASAEGGEQFTFEHFDDLDLSEALGKVSLKFERLKWSQDCSMLSVQLSSGHLLIYQTQVLHDHMVASHGAKTAYLSGPSEITLLNYGFDDTTKPLSIESEARRNSTSSSRAGTPLGGNAIILSLPFKPSLLAIGPRHLAVALNNRVRFYTIERILKLNNQLATDNQRSMERRRQEFAEQEYVTLVVGIGLSSKFVATMLDDGRLKLHSLNQLEGETFDAGSGETASERSLASEDEVTDGLVDDERFFPDPGHTTQRISAFTLTEELLVYCTADCQIHVFSMKHWHTVQAYEHSDSFKAPVCRLKPNDRGNKFICLLEVARHRPDSKGSSSETIDQTDANVYLYDLFSNKMFKLDCNESQLINQLSRKLIERLQNQLPSDLASSLKLAKSERFAPMLSRIVDVIWDTDGRSVLFIQTKSIHVVAILEHTLEQEEPLAIYAGSAKKSASHSTLYVSEGIVSYQTSLGRVINSILGTHDDELKLTRLEHRIKLISDQFAATASEGESNESPLCEAHFEVLLLKLEYLRSILPIYSLLKCRDICEHLMEEPAFRLRTEQTSSSPLNSWIMEADRVLWRQLASWAIFTLNLNFAQQIFQQHGLGEEAKLLSDLFETMRATGFNSKPAINEKLFNLLNRR